MTREEKELLIKDLCGRLPYNVLYVEIVWEDGVACKVPFVNTGIISDLICDEIKSIKPYLRLMSSMTVEEKNFYYSCLDEMDGYKQTFPVIYQDKALSLLDFLNAHHFDYRDLVPMGLALEAPEDMYKND